MALAGFEASLDSCDVEAGSPVSCVWHVGARGVGDPVRLDSVDAARAQLAEDNIALGIARVEAAQDRFVVAGFVWVSQPVIGPEIPPAGARRAVRASRPPRARATKRGPCTNVGLSPSRLARR